MPDLIAILQEWFLINCNGDWEHTHGCRIGTLDNPGWYVEIDLDDTYLDVMSFTEINIQKNIQSDWIVCKIEKKTFKGYGDPNKLGDIIKVFMTWKENADRTLKGTS